MSDQIKEASAEKITTIKANFAMLDENKDGFISIKELRSIFECNGEQISDLEIAKFIQKHDENSDGQLNFEEFIKWWIEVGL